MKKLNILTAILLVTLPMTAAADTAGDNFSADVVALDGGTLLVVGPPTWIDESFLKSQRTPIPLEAGRTKIRLWGVKAPALDETGGWHALAALDAELKEAPGQLEGSSRVNCTVMIPVEPRADDQAILAICSAAKRNLGASLLVEGWAVVDRMATWSHAPGETDALFAAHAYDVFQKQAMNSRKGLWALPQR